MNLIRKRNALFVIIVCNCLVLGCNRTKTNNPAGALSATAAIRSVSAKISDISPVVLKSEKLIESQASHTPIMVFAKNGSSVAYIEPFEGKFRVVHNGVTGKTYEAISELIVTDDGKRVAYVGRLEGTQYVTIVDGKELYPFSTDDSHMFSPDGSHYISTVTRAGRRFMVIDNTIVDKYGLERNPVISSDSKKLVFSVKAVDGSGTQLIVSDINLKNKVSFDTCGTFIHTNPDSTLVATGCTEGLSKTIKVIDLANTKVISSTVIDGTLTHLRFGPDKQTLLYTYAKNDNKRYVVYKGNEEQIPTGDEFMSDPVLLSNPDSVGVIIGDVFKVRMYRAFQESNKNGKYYGYISDFIATPDGRHHAFLAVDPAEEQQYLVIDGNEGRKFDKIVSPQFTPDGRFIVFRVRQDRKRFIVVADLKGKIVHQYQDYSMIFQPQFIGNGKSIAFGVVDNNELWWKVEKLPTPN